MTIRTDIHRKGAINPSEYSYIMSYSLSTTEGGEHVPSYNINCMLDNAIVGGPHGAHAPDGMCCVLGMRESGKPFAEYGSTGKCTICGAAFIYGDIWQHEPTGVFIHVGHDCADKMHHCINRAGFDASRERFVAISKRKMRLEAYLIQNPDMREVFDCADRNPIIADMRQKVMTYGDLSEKQVAYAKKLANGILNPKQSDDEPAPLLLNDGRQTLQGRFVGVKQVDTVYGYTLKGMLLVERDGQLAKVWMSIPKGCDHNAASTAVTVTVEKPKDGKPGFYFGSRPSCK